ncbi:MULTISPECIES: purine-cytosine permease family protein [Paraburkholderia]|uniref:purine-cytosine permease family protein n=1 Tax=Paraburkholderia caledonica TaxID=134536 RepID=UPI000B48FBE7|nr:cytosine permease [Burkholderia sp. Bk]
MSSSKDIPAVTSVIERRSLDFIPESERHGTAFGQFTLWLGVNLNITAIVTGALAVVLGGDVFWSLIGLAIGQVLGSVVMGLQASFGPAVGLPQMIRSRVQFGVFGAVIPLLLVSVLYVGFSAGGTLLAGQAVARILDVADWTGIVTFGIVTLLLATLGYRVIHSIAKVASVVGVAAFVYMFAALLSKHDVGELLGQRHFVASHFVFAISLAAAWQISYGPYVADYSRYLPVDTWRVRVFFAAALGTILGSQASMTFGVFAAALAGAAFSGHEVQFVVGLGATGAMASALFFVVGFGKITMMTLNAYSSYMSTATIIGAFTRTDKVSLRHRFFYVLGMVSLAVIIALTGSHTFIKSFSSFLIFLLTFITPWSAISIVDYFFVNGSRYDLDALSDPSGRYGKWNLPTIAVYCCGVLIELPFISSGFYTGPIARALAYADVSWLVGLLATGLMYFVVARKQRGMIVAQTAPSIEMSR